MRQLLLADILEFTKKVLLKNFTFCAHCDNSYEKSVLLAGYFKLL